MKGKRKVCKDCYPNGPDPWVKTHNLRPAPHPGPRCATHHSDITNKRRKAAHDKRVQDTYGLGPGEYDRLYEFQAGCCWLCQRARGVTKRLAVDHDHKTGEVRGLLCGPCNKLLGHARDDCCFFYRAAAYLADPPYKQMKDQEE